MNMVIEGSTDLLIYVRPGSRARALKRRPTDRLGALVATGRYSRFDFARMHA